MECTMLWEVLIISVATFNGNYVAESSNVSLPIVMQDGDVIQPPVDYLTKHYFKDQSLTWNLAAETGVWALVFNNFSVEEESECRFDYVEILEYTNTSAVDFEVPPSRFCGLVRPRPYISKQSRVQIRFITDSIWEDDGFTIQVIHSRNKGMLQQKLARLISRYKAQDIVLPTDKAPTNTDDDLSIQSTFYILIGSSLAALLIFCGLFIYFAVNSFVKQQSRCQRERSVFFTSRSGSGQQLATVVMTTGIGRKTRRWRRYSRDKDAPSGCATLAAGTGACNSLQKDSNNDSESQHNNLYVSHV